MSKEYKLNPDKLPNIPDMLPANISNVALATKHGQWDQQRLITAIQTHIYSGQNLNIFLNKENSLAIINELLLISPEIKITKILHKWRSILNRGCHLTKNARKKLARMIREYIPLNIKSKNIKSKSIDINITESSSKLPFVEGPK